jgi:hypothetical protein
MQPCVVVSKKAAGGGRFVEFLLIISSFNAATAEANGHALPHSSPMMRLIRLVS